MTLKQLVAKVTDKERFSSIEAYVEFARMFLDYVAKDIQATIVSQNEPHYHFWQYRKEGHFNVSRPFNSELMLTNENCDAELTEFLGLLECIRDSGSDTLQQRQRLSHCIYSLQQTIGIALDALPAGQSNQARKINGDLFERLIRLLLVRVGVNCTSGTVSVPVVVDNKVQSTMSFQHDLIVKDGEFVKTIGSVKTSSKDRLGKIFVDKFLLQKLTDKEVPHVAIFLNDVQRKKTANARQYGVSATFLPGHFKAFTLKINPLDGVYYCDLRPNMRTDPILQKHIRTIDHFFFGDIWSLISRNAVVAKMEDSVTHPEMIAEELRGAGRKHLRSVKHPITALLDERTTDEMQ